VKTLFRKNLEVLILAASGLSFYLIVSVFVFTDALYNETNLKNLKDTGEIFVSLLPENYLAAYIENYTQLRPEQRKTGFAGFPRLGNETPCRFTLIRKDGLVVADSYLNTGEIENHLNRPEVEAALRGEAASARRNSQTLGEEYIYWAVPVYTFAGEPVPPGDAAGSVAGVFRLARLTPRLWRRLFPAAFPFLIPCLLAVLGVFAAVYAYSRTLAGALKRLAVTAGEAGNALSRFPMGEGNSFDIREFNVLDTALRTMAGELIYRINAAGEEGRRLEAILNGMSEAVFAMDSNLMLLLANPQAQDLFGINGERDIRTFSLLEATHSAELEEAAKEVLAGGGIIEPETLWRPGGKDRCFRIFAAPLKGGPGPAPGLHAGEKSGGVVMILGDITRLHKLEQVRKDFVANVSHELRTPIQIIKGFAETLLDSYLENPGQVRRCIEIILKNAGAMENLINDLLTLVRLEDGGAVRPETRETALGEVLEEAISSVEFQARKKNITLRAAYDPGLKAKLSSPFIIQAVINLLDNAVKYSPPNSPVLVEAFIDDSRNPSGELVIAVKDKGIGIPSGELDRIFERFYRVNRGGFERAPAGKSKESRGSKESPGIAAESAAGTGLGLSIVRHIALLHRGSVEAESHAGEGSVFRIRVPR
jgi:two-component system phosphate regulon sensor histidine kinase PhoR